MKTQKTQLLVLALLICSSLSVQAQETRNVGDFTGIKANGTFDIVISQSDANSVKIDADDKTKALIKTEVKEGILIISTTGISDMEKPIKIGVKSLNSLIVSGSSDVKTDNQLICDKLSIESSGAGDLHLNVKASEITAQVSGAGDVIVKGTAQSLTANVSGAGDLRASNLIVDKAKVKVSGAGNGKINVKQNLDAEVSGAGNIIYRGKPTERTINISGAGSIRESKSGNGEETASDTTKLKFGKKKYVIINDGNDDDEDDDVISRQDSINDWNEGFKLWNGVEFGLNNIFDFKNTTDAPTGSTFLELNTGKSWQFGLNLFEKDFHLYKNYINFVTGLGFDFNHYAFKNNVTLDPNATFLTASTDLTDYSKNTLNVSYVKAPLMLEFNTGKKASHNFHIALGAQFEYRIHNVLKQEYEIDGKHYKTKVRNDFNLAPFLYSATARIGYNNVTLFANYGLNGLFRKDQGPQVFPVSAGISFTL